MTRDLLKKNHPDLAVDGALEICIIKVRLFSVLLERNPLNNSTVTADDRR
jgi:hypothetical protein